MNYTLSEARKIFKNAKGVSFVRVGEVELRSLIYDDNKMMYSNAGFYGDNDALLSWKKKYMSSIVNADLLMNVYTCNSFTITSKLLMDVGLFKDTIPYWEEDLSFWLDVLDDMADIKQEIGIISYFADEMKSQQKHLDKIHNRKISNKFSYIQTYNTCGGGPHKDFFETLEIMKKKIDKSTADYFLVSCGCYGLLLCDYIKDKGKNAIYVGGQLQLLFGLKGARWDERKNISKLYNKYWKYPNKKPKNYKTIEGGCYWEGTEDSKGGDFT